MYAQFFGLKQEPFSIAPDPHYLFMSERHREALAHLLYGLRGGGGFVLLTGEIGAGKTTVCRCFLEQIPKKCNVAYVFNPKLTALELLQTIAEEFHIRPRESAPAGEGVKQLVDAINEFLLRTHAVGMNNVLIIDEAQLLSTEVLEQLRLLTNLETRERKLLQIILIGQPELREMLAAPELEQLAQRVIARFHLPALSAAETWQYIKHRLTVAGLRGSSPFEGKLRERIHQLSRGVPRRINLLCDRALLGAYSQGQSKVSVATLNRAAQEVFGAGRGAAAAPATAPGAGVDTTPLPVQRRWMAAGVLVLAAVLGVLFLRAKAVPEPKPSPSLPAKALAASAPLPAASAAPLALAASASPRPVTSAASASSAASAASAMALTASGVEAPAIPTSAAEAWQALASLRQFLSARAPGAPAMPLPAIEAWQGLARLWQYPGNLREASDFCAALRGAQLQCFYSRDGGLALLRLLSRPSLLILAADAEQAPRYALLLSLGPQSATLQMAGGITQRFSLLQLSRIWQGEFITLWRAPASLDGAVPSFNGNSAALTWLDQQLSQALGEAPREPSGKAGSKGNAPAVQRLDAALRAKVARFQRSQGLPSDGQPGPITVMQLNRVNALPEPLLQGP